MKRFRLGTGRMPQRSKVNRQERMAPVGRQLNAVRRMCSMKVKGHH